jgi:ribosomal protein S12 methylthiotransferase accessory factor
VVIAYSKPKLRRTFDIVIPRDKDDVDTSNNSSRSVNGSGIIIFKSEHQTIRFTANQKFIQRVISLLNGTNTVEQIFSSLSMDYKREDIDRCISVLAQHNLIEEGGDDIVDSSSTSSSSSSSPHMAIADKIRLSPQIQFLKDIDIDVDTALKKIKESKVAIVGLGAHGAVLASALANEGVGYIKCLDPSVISNEDLYLSSVAGAGTIYKSEDIGKRREDAFFEYMQNAFPLTKIEISNVKENVTEKDIEKWISDAGSGGDDDDDNDYGCDFAICCIDRGFLSMYYWLNKIALRKERKKSFRWLAASIEGLEGVIGPMIIPGDSACYMCYKMRSAAASERSYADGMAYNEYLNNNKKDELYRRPNLAIAAGIVGNFAAVEVIKALIGMGTPLIGKTSLLGRICVINFLNMTTQFHKVLRRPDCPHCGLKKNDDNDDDDYSHKETITSSYGSALLSKIESNLVSAKVGVIKSINRLQKDDSEPHIPYIFEALLSNPISESYGNIATASPGNSITNLGHCYGEGLTLQEAKISALKKAVRIYCASQYYDEKKIMFASYKQLLKDNKNNNNDSVDVINPTLDSLLLYSDEKYSPGLPHTRSSEEDVPIDWVEGQSIVTSKKVFVPARAVYLHYNRLPNKNSEYHYLLTSACLTAGLGTDATYTLAVLHALLEVVERDAFMITWLCKLPMPKVDLNSTMDIVQNDISIGDSDDNYKAIINDIVKAYERRGIAINVNALILDTKNIPTFMATAIDSSSGRSDSPASAIGLACHPISDVAILKAILEAGQARQYLRRKMRMPNYKGRLASIKKFENIKNMEDHALLYTDIQMLEAFDFLLHNRSSQIDISKLPNNNKTTSELGAQEGQLLDYCTTNLRKIRADTDIVAVDVTTPDILTLGLYVARVFITGFEPIRLGSFSSYKEDNLYGIKNNSRLFELPQKLGFYDKPLSIKQLNAFPHPFGGEMI